MRGEKADEKDRTTACANCRQLRFLKYEEPTRFGITGFHFCRVQYRETGEIEDQPWNWTCESFELRAHHNDKNKRLHMEEVPVVEESGVLS